MRAIVLVLFVALALTPTTFAQQTLDRPVGEWAVYHLDTGWIDAGPRVGVPFSDAVVVEDAAWLRLYFAEVVLGRGSVVRITSLLDGEVQELDATGLAQWEWTSAYFNGGAVLLELIPAPNTSNRVVLGEVAYEIGGTVAGCSYPCGICGTDNRVASDELWSGRILPSGCSGSVYNEDSCLVSAGHCMGGSMVIQFNVPPSSSNCNLNMPPIADQFPIADFDFQNTGVGGDWAAMTSGTNNLGQTIFERYGEFRPIATTGPVNGQSLDIWGYGIDPTCTQSQTQQTSGGSVNGVSGLFFQHTVDATCGNSGSGVIRGGSILGIATHCPCPNVAMRVDHPSFAAARAAICQPPTPVCPGGGDCCVPNGTPGCDDLDCCETICACDPFCCDVEWDARCAPGNGNGGSGCGAALPCAVCMEPPTPSVELTDVAVLSGFPVDVELSSLLAADDDHVVIDAAEQGVRFNAIADVLAQCSVTTVSQLDVLVEVAPAGASPVFLSILLFDYDSNTFRSVGFAILSTSQDTVKEIIDVADPNRFIADDGQMRMLVAHTSRAPQTPDGYTAMIDLVEITVE